MLQPATVVTAYGPVALIPSPSSDSADLLRRAAQSRTPYLVFAPDAASLEPDQLARQTAYLDAHPQRPFQNWIGADESGVPDERRYREATGLILALLTRGVAPPSSVMLRRQMVEIDEVKRVVIGRQEGRATGTLQLALSACLSYAIAGPEYVQIGPSDACNARCLFCLHHSPLINPAGTTHKGMLQWESWRDCLDDLTELGVPRVDYVGIGEPTMHPRIDEALAYGSARFTQNMISNGLLLGKHLRAVADHLDWLTISLNALTPSTQHTLHLTGEKGFTRTVDAIRELTSMQTRRTQVSISFVVNRENFRQVRDLPTFCQDLDIRAGLTPLGAYEQTADRLALHPDEERELFDILDALAETPDHRIVNLDQFRMWHDRDTSAVARQIPCYIGLIFAQIRGDGSVSHCCACDEGAVGNIHERRFKDIWRSVEYRRFRKDALFTMLDTQAALPGCHCDICGFAGESIRVHNRLHDTTLTMASLKAAHAARQGRPGPDAASV